MSFPWWMSREMVSCTLSPLFLIVSETWGFYGEKPRPLWWALPSDNEGHASVLSACIQTGRQGRRTGTRWLLGDVVRSCVHVPLYLYLKTRINELIYIFTPCQCFDCFISCSLHSTRENVKRKLSQMCLFSSDPKFYSRMFWLSILILYLFYTKPEVF